jgi:hypothetical protein
MTEQNGEPTLPSVEAAMFGVLLGFHQKAMTLLRRSLLDDEKMKVVGDRIKTLLDDIAAETAKAKQFDLTERLETAYDELRRLVEKLSGSSVGDKDRPEGE